MYGKRKALCVFTISAFAFQTLFVNLNVALNISAYQFNTVSEASFPDIYLSLYGDLRE